MNSQNKMHTIVIIVEIPLTNTECSESITDIVMGGLGMQNNPDDMTQGNNTLMPLVTVSHCSGFSTEYP